MGIGLTEADIAAARSSLTLRAQALIDGRFVDAMSGATFESISPGDGSLLAQVAACDSEDIDRAVAAARRAFDSGVWSQMAPKQRKARIVRFADLMMEHRLELALLETLDMGKPISDSHGIDVPTAANAIQWYGEACDKVYDEVAPVGPNGLGLITREPIGVVGAIVPWNFPLLMAAWKIGPVLAMGNSLVLKPAEQSPLSALRIGELALEAGIPEGVFNVVPGLGPTAGKALALHMDVDCLTFTGSGEVGKLLLQYSGQSNMKKVWLECGGKTPNVVLSDAPDIEAVGQAAALGIFFNQGEVCTAASRLIVADSVKDQVLEVVTRVGREMQPGDPLDPQTRLGAIVDARQMQKVLGYVERGVAEGATLRLGGERVRADSGGFYVPPTIFDNVRNDMTVARDEIFGPVLSTIPFKDEADAVAMANDTSYGLAACVWTRDIGKAHRVARQLRAGLVWVNCWDGGDITMPFGGYKQSGNGRDRSLHALDKYSEMKSTYIDLTH